MSTLEEGKTALKEASKMACGAILCRTDPTLCEDATINNVEVVEISDD